MISDVQVMKAMVDAQVFGARGEWEKHEIAGHATYVKPIAVLDPELKARIATRYDELGFVPVFFKESGREYVALENVKKSGRYKNIEEAFVKQILTKL